MLALVRLLCQPRVMGEAALELAPAFDVYRRFTALPEGGLRAEPEGCESGLEAMASTLEPPLPARLWTDAYLAAFAIGAGLRLVTFDPDFERFAGLDYLRLPASAG
jgi:predicted nucleic acid-binding protein